MPPTIINTRSRHTTPHTPRIPRLLYSCSTSQRTTWWWPIQTAETCSCTQCNCILHNENIVVLWLYVKCIIRFVIELTQRGWHTSKLGYSNPITGPETSWGFQQLEVSRFQHSWDIKAVRLSALHTDRLYSSGYIPGTHFCHRLSAPQAHCDRRIKSVKTYYDTIGNRTRNFPACCAMSQTTVPPRAPVRQ